MPSLRYAMSKARLLVIESDPVMSQRLLDILLPHVGTAEVAADCEQGVARWRDSEPDVILTEINVPGLDGMAMSERIRADDPDAAIIVISSSVETEHLRRAIEIGVDAYVFKPVDPMLLLDAVARCMRDRQRVLELKMARMVFEVANEGIIVTDERTRILAVNPAFSEITGFRPDEVVGRRTTVLSSGVHPPEFYRAMWDTLLTHGRWSGEIINRRKDGAIFSEWLSIAAVESGNALSQCYVGLVSDISERKKEEEHIRRLAHFDSLTGLPNRTLFNDRLHRALARSRRYRHSLAVLYIDLDHFKQINDTWGHAVGDEALQIAAGRMVQALRQSDTVSRRGGDEFVVILDLNDHPEGLINVCQKLVDEICRPFHHEHAVLQLGVSIGVATYPNDAETADELLAAADTALYEAKASGRGQFRFFRPEAQLTACQRLGMERELRAGLADWRYSLRYLPEISLHTGQVEQLEALLRFHHPEFGLMEAGRFLDIAEEIGLMPELGKRALAEALRELAALGEEHGQLGLVVDLSARQLADPHVVRHLLDTLSGCGMPERSITFECTEAALTGNEFAVQNLLDLAAAGCKFTLDDFGAGFCSFSLISQLPMSSIKIDRSFTRDMLTNPQIGELVGALIAFSKRLGLRTVAEGVESEAQLQFLRAAGCDAAQGYLFGLPMHFDELLASHSRMLAVNEK